MMMIIDLGDFMTKRQVKVLSGRENGANLRSQYGLDQFDKGNEVFEVKIPEDIFSMNTSFFLAMFGNSVRKLGEENFKMRYRFICPEFLLPEIDDGIRRALKETRALDV